MKYVTEVKKKLDSWIIIQIIDNFQWPFSDIRNDDRINFRKQKIFKMQFQSTFLFKTLFSHHSLYPKNASVFGDVFGYKECSDQNVQKREKLQNYILHIFAFLNIFIRPFLISKKRRRLRRRFPDIRNALITMFRKEKSFKITFYIFLLF